MPEFRLALPVIDDLTRFLVVMCFTHFLIAQEDGTSYNVRQLMLKGDYQEAVETINEKLD